MKRAEWVFLPVVGMPVAHGPVLSLDLLRALKRPISARAFGANKTWRGALVMGGGTFLAALALDRVPAYRERLPPEVRAAGPVRVGALLGLAVVAGELPNSFVKRQLDVRPGEAARGTIGLVLYLVDQVDLLVGAWLAFALILDVRLVWVLWSVVIVAVVHQLLTTVTYALGMRASSR